MRKLNRNAVPVPQCLENVPEGWSYRDLRRSETAEIREALLAIQGGCCAYCERRTGEDAEGGHIEHFRNQANHQDLTLGWSNLFWSCRDENSCGKYKDKCNKHAGVRASFQSEDLIDPSSDDPDEYLLFISDGTVRPKDGLGEVALKKARETLRVFNLHDHAYLRKSRQDAVKPYLGIIELLQQTAPDQVAAYVQIETANLQLQPFSTVIRHFFRDYA